MINYNKLSKIFLPSLVKTFFFVAFFLILVACSKSKENNHQYMYSPFFPSKEQVWMSREEALKAPKMSGMVEVNRFVGIEQTPQQRHAADDLYEKTLSHLSKNGWFDFEKALLAGYIDDPATDALHFTNYDYIFDNDFLNPEKPEYLMFYNTSEGYRLAGVMFVQDDAGVHGDQIGGPETVWHFHYYGEGYCVPMRVPKSRLKKNKVSQAHCADGQLLLKESPEMLHLWFVNHPQGRFASSMAIDYSLILESDLIREETRKAKAMK